MSVKRFLVFRLLPAAGLLAVLFGLQVAFGLSPAPAVETAKACNPCECENDRRLNCLGNEFYAVYARESRTTCTIDVYLISNQGRGTGRPAFRITAAERAGLPEKPEENLLVDEYYEVALYKLTTGEYQVNAGPDQNGKVYVVRFTGCPAENINEETFIPAQAQ